MEEKIIPSADRIYTPSADQVRAVDHLCRVPRAALFPGCGFGKTYVTLLQMEYLIRLGMIERVLIVAPKQVCANVWGQEIHKFGMSDTLKCVFFHNDVGTGNNVEHALRGNVTLVTPAGAEKLLVHFDETGAEYPWQQLVLDESSMYRAIKSNRTKAMVRLSKKMKRVVLLSGTPMPRQYEDLFSQFKVLDLGQTFGKYVIHFREAFTIRTPPFGSIDKPLAEVGKIITNRIQPRTFSDENSSIKLPELKVIQMDVPLSAAAKKAYRQTAFKIKDKEALGANAVIEDVCFQLLQKASGAVYVKYSVQDQAEQEYLDADGEVIHQEKEMREVQILHNDKIKYFMNLLHTEIGKKKTIAAYSFKHTRDRVVEELRKTKQYRDQIFTPDRPEDLERFMESDCGILLAHPAATGYGLNLQGNCDIVFLDGLYNAEHFFQLIRRVWRQGQEYPVRAFLLASEGTADAIAFKGMQDKLSNQEILINMVQDAIKNGIIQVGQ